MVTWGVNTVHTLGPSPSSGAPSQPSSTFGAPSAFSFGASPAPATAATGGLFGGGSSPAPSSGGFFGANPSTAPSANLFGSSSSTSSTNVFGTPAPATSVFGSQQQQQQRQQLPAQAAMLAHMDASARQEAERVRNKLQKIYLAYAGQACVDEDSNQSSKFVAVTYNLLSPEERQLQIIHGVTMGGLSDQQILAAPPRPPQVCEHDWKMAVVKNPDPENYVPVALIGAAALQGRVSWQQEQAKEAAKNAKAVQDILEFIRQREGASREDLLEKERKYIALRHRLLELMSKVEIARGYNKPLQPDEFRALQRLQALLGRVETLQTELSGVLDQTKGHRHQIQKRTTEPTSILTQLPDQDKLLAVLSEQRRKLGILTDTAKQDIRDLKLVGQRVVTTVTANIPFH